MSRVYCLTIAGFDPSGGAGLNADTKVFSKLGVFDLSVCTAITVQTESTFESCAWIDSGLISSQLGCLLSTYDVKFVKIGLIEDQVILNQVLDVIRSKTDQAFVIWDPILKASAGFDFGGFDQLETILSKVDLVTPNKMENEDLQITKYKLTSVLETGGANDADTLYQKGEQVEIPTKTSSFDKHGTGCVYSAAILVYCAKGNDLKTACLKAKQYIYDYIESDESLLGLHHKVNVII